MMPNQTQHQRREINEEILRVTTIPKQWVPGWIRWSVRAFVLPFVLLDLAAQWIARQIIRPPYRQEGRCLKRGNCCHYILVPAPRTILTLFFYFWFTQFNGFFLRHSQSIEIDGKKWLIMGCRYLKKEKTCAHYRLRPMICRQWPLIKHFAHPQIFKGCGFRAVLRKKK